MTYTPEQLRKDADAEEAAIRSCHTGYGERPDEMAMVDQLRAHAAALETIRERDAEIELLKDAVQFREAEMSRRVKECLATASDEITKREKAEAEIARLRGHCTALHDRLIRHATGRIRIEADIQACAAYRRDEEASDDL